MSTLRRELENLRKLARERKLEGKTREEYPDGIERDAYDIYRFLEAQREMDIDGAADEDPYTYEEILEDLECSGQY